MLGKRLSHDMAFIFQRTLGYIVSSSKHISMEFE